ncbi:hypothetical protein BN3661_00959 [Eubacteriaceae bacterium CHKCI005]|nr:hypothetical protein BN3661_00959 [Eubacteriaceae bacterium CHKCI005]
MAVKMRLPTDPTDIVILKVFTSPFTVLSTASFVIAFPLSLKMPTVSTFAVVSTSTTNDSFTFAIPALDTDRIFSPDGLAATEKLTVTEEFTKLPPTAAVAIVSTRFSPWDATAVLMVHVLVLSSGLYTDFMPRMVTYLPFSLRRAKRLRSAEVLMVRVMVSLGS